MNFYPFHISDFYLHTSHLTLVEEAIYSRLLNYYYDTEAPIPAEPEKTQWVIRRLRLKTHEEMVSAILAEFFTLEADGWHNARADREIAVYETKAETARANGKRGGRPKKNKDLQSKEPKITQPVISANPAETGSKANQEPITNNQEEPKTLVPSPPAEALDPPATVATLPTNRFNTTGELFRVTADMLPDWEAAYPAVNVVLEIQKAKSWLQDNPTKRKTIGGMRKFLGSWLSRQQDKGGSPNANTSGFNRQPVNTGRLSGAERTREARELARQRELAQQQSDLGCVGEPEGSVPRQYG